MRWIAFTSINAGFVLGIASLSVAGGTGPTGKTIVGYMNPPTLSSGSSSWLNCGWHAACGATPTAGTALDWDDENTGYDNPVYFRDSLRGRTLQIPRSA